MHISTLLSPLLLPLVLAVPTRRDSTTALALVAGYTNDTCAWPPFGPYVLDFEPTGEGQCVGNGTVVRGVYVEKLQPGCVVNAYTFANCTGEVYRLDQVGCWVQFTVGNVDLGVQGVDVVCNASAASSSVSAMPTSMRK